MSAPAPGPYGEPAPPLSPADEKTWAVVLHVGGIFFGVLAPLVGYLLLRERGPFVRHHSVAALNFQLTLLVPYLLGLGMMAFGGLFVVFAAWVLSIVFGILAARATNDGHFHRYPFAIEFVRG